MRCWAKLYCHRKSIRSIVGFIFRKHRVSAPAIKQELINIAGSSGALLDGIGMTVAFALDHICDGEDFDDVDAAIKSHFGTKFEKYFINLLDLPRKVGKKKNPHNLHLDTRIAGTEVDVKCTLCQNWMIPPEAIDHWCLVLKVDPYSLVYSIGLLQATAENISKGCNRDRKRSVSKAGKTQIDWIFTDESFEPFTSDEAIREMADAKMFRPKALCAPKVHFSDKTILSAMLHYGSDKFDFSIIEVCDSIDVLRQREMYWINEYKSTDRNYGYNCTTGGEMTWLSVMSAEDRVRFSDLKREQMNATWAGRSDEERKRIMKTAQDSRWKNVTEQERLDFGKRWLEKRDIQAHATRVKANWDSLTPAERYAKSDGVRQYAKNLPKEEMAVRVKKASDAALKKSQKSYTVIDPDGKVYDVCGMKAFCREHGLTPDSMYRVAKGKISNTKGWTCVERAKK
jgi:hypothetical protein